MVLLLLSFKLYQCPYLSCLSLGTYNGIICLEVRSCMKGTTAVTAGKQSFRTNGTAGCRVAGCISQSSLTMDHTQGSVIMHSKLEGSPPSRHLPLISCKLALEQNEKAVVEMMSCCLDQLLVAISRSLFEYQGQVGEWDLSSWLLSLPWFSKTQGVEQQLHLQTGAKEQKTENKHRTSLESFRESV